MSQVDQRQNTRQDGFIQLAILRLITLEQRDSVSGAIDRLGDEKVRPCIDLPTQILDLCLEIWRTQVERRADKETGGLPNACARMVRAS